VSGLYQFSSNFPYKFIYFLDEKAELLPSSKKIISGIREGVAKNPSVALAICGWVLNLFFLTSKL
jgi:hypothetical protein